MSEWVSYFIPVQWSIHGNGRDKAEWGMEDEVPLQALNSWIRPCFLQHPHITPPHPNQTPMRQLLKWGFMPRGNWLAMASRDSRHNFLISCGANGHGRLVGSEWGMGREWGGKLGNFSLLQIWNRFLCYQLYFIRCPLRLSLVEYIAYPLEPT